MSEAHESETPEPGIAGVAVHAEELGLDGPHGPVFRDITFDLPAGALGAVEGPSGSGRTCLLLALTGRMKVHRGQAQVGRHRLPKQMAAVRRISALGPVPGITDLEPSLTVAEHLRERVLLQQRFGDSLRTLLRPHRERAASRTAAVDAALEAAGLDTGTLPKGLRTRAQDLERLEALRLSVAMAMMARPRLLVVDDLDLKLSDDEREQAWALLHSLTGHGTTVLAACSQAAGEAVVIRTERAGGEESRPGRGKRGGRTKRGTTPEAAPDGNDGTTPDTAHNAAKSGDKDDTAAGSTGGTTKEEAADALAEARRA